MIVRPNRRRSFVHSAGQFCLLTLFVAAQLYIDVSAQVDPVCRHPLGMQDMRILDSALSATSSHALGTGPKYARLNRDEGDGAWCPSGVVSPNSETEYIQIKLPQLSVISTIATQGRFGAGSGREFVRTYKFNYSRDGQNWKQWSNYQGLNLMKGNTDMTSISKQSISPPVTGAEYVRIIPVTNRPQSVCLRLELYGCVWKSGLNSYEIPSPDDAQSSTNARSPSRTTTSFSDDTYDGRKGKTVFRGGLGQLTDGIIGDDDIGKVVSRNQRASPGYDYVGWSKAATSDGSITLQFRFIDIRNFTEMRIHCSNDIGKGARLFSSIEVAFGLNGVTYPDTAGSPHMAYNVNDDTGDTSARFVTVPLNHAIARYIRARIHLRDRLLLISEIEFINAPLSPDASKRYASDIPDQNPGENPEDPNEPTVTPSHMNNIPIIVGCLVGVIVLLVVIVLGLCYRQHRLRKTLTPPRYTYTTTGRPGGSRNDHMVTLTPLVTQSGPGGSHQTTVMTEKPPVPIYQEIDPVPTRIPHDNVYLEPTDVVMSSPPPYQSLPEVTQLAEQASSRRRQFDQPDVLNHGESSNTSHYAETDMFLATFDAQPIQGVTGNNIYAVPWTSPSPKRQRRKKNAKKSGTLSSDDASSSMTTPSAASTLLADAEDRLGLLTDLGDDPPEFPRSKLEFVERLGEGQFGEVQLCKADPVIRDVAEEDGFVISGSPGKPVMVAVKVLREDASSNAMDDFLKEVRIMSRLQDPNIVRLIAVCTRDQPYAMITEYMENGDLNQYLRGFNDDFPASSPSSSNQRSSGPAISNDIIMKMAAQIASGMKYLASLNFVHRDLATRNCLVGADHSIRIADFGMSRNMYQSDYYRIQGKAVLPIRWMSWECVLMGKFSSASDVWSFGVTLWEMFSLCKYQPFSGLTDQQVIENMHHMFRRTGDEVFLPRPKRCPAALFNMIRQCWKRSSEDRPTFEQMYTYLKERVRTKPDIKTKPPQVKPPPPK
uniref:Epithelial discoidin domain-containing receptor 1 n=1 Tax=Phallusia mammillata TaxID=59560 RepID=A0A6F9D9Z7_9ASCI|nr:epithelial discoidin domain-containing receptor 1 [Phallusia mammillata]